MGRSRIEDRISAARRDELSLPEAISVATRAHVSDLAVSTSAPGRTRCRPLTTTRSPGFRPEVTMRSPSTVPPSVTSR